MEGDCPKDEFYLSLPAENVAVYEIDLPANTTVYGVPEIHVKLSPQNTNLDGMMITAVLVDSKKDGEEFKSYMLKSRLYDTLLTKTIDSYSIGGGYPDGALKEFVPSNTLAKCISYGWTDLCNPALVYSSKEYTKRTDLAADTYYDYTFYMLPTVYTLEEGHSLKLVLMSWDPFRVFLEDENELLDREEIDDANDEIDYHYSFRIDNTSIDVQIPTR